MNRLLTIPIFVTRFTRRTCHCDHLVYQTMCNIPKLRPRQAKAISFRLQIKVCSHCAIGSAIYLWQLIGCKETVIVAIAPFEHLHWIPCNTLVARKELMAVAIATLKMCLQLHLYHFHVRFRPVWTNLKCSSARPYVIRKLPLNWRGFVAFNAAMTCESVSLCAHGACMLVNILFLLWTTCINYCNC